MIETHRYFSCGQSLHELMPEAAARGKAGREADTTGALQLIRHRVMQFDRAEPLYDFCADAGAPEAVAKHGHAHRLGSVMTKIGTAVQGTMKRVFAGAQSMVKAVFEQSKHALSSLRATIWSPRMQGKHDMAVAANAQALKGNAALHGPDLLFYEASMDTLSKALKTTSPLDAFKGAGVTYDCLESYHQLRGSRSGDPLRSLVTNLGYMCLNTSANALCFGANEDTRRQVGKLRESFPDIDAVCASLTPWGDDRKWNEMEKSISDAQAKAGANFDKDEYFPAHFGHKLSADISRARSFLKHLHSVFHDERF